MLSGGYRDDEDYGEVVKYTGHGGQGGKRRQVRDQTAEDSGNAALRTSMLEALPVRVIRGPNRDSLYAPTEGYTYSGDYYVTDSWIDRGIEGFQMVFFTLELIPGEGAIEKPEPEAAADPESIVYKTTTASRRVRDAQVSFTVKSMYGHSCQICGLQIRTAGGRLYAEGAHIKPLGLPHSGADRLDNILCLCPNHHAQLDLGEIVILDDLRVVETVTGRSVGAITLLPRHRLDLESIRYLRGLHAAELTSTPPWPVSGGAEKR